MFNWIMCCSGGSRLKLQFRKKNLNYILNYNNLLMFLSYFLLFNIFFRKNYLLMSLYSVKVCNLKIFK